MEAPQQILGVLLVLGLLGGSLWWLRSKGLAQFAARGVAGAGKARSLRLIERLPLSSQHTLHLVSLEGRAVLIATSPNGCAILDRPSNSSPDGSGTR